MSAVAAAAAGLWATSMPLAAQPAPRCGKPPEPVERRVELGTGTQTADEVKRGLFPEEELALNEQVRADLERCERLCKEGVQCLPVGRVFHRYSLPGVNFALGSAALPERMKSQLQAFAEALRGRQAGSPAIRIEGHADATGSPEANRQLSQRRAEAVRSFLVSQGVAPQLLAVEGLGSAKPKEGSDPASAENRRVEIARQQAR